MRTANLQHQTDRRATILDAAEHCFSRSGFHQTSMSDICQAAGMSPGNLYRYFPSKEAIIAGIIERHRMHASEDIEAIENAPSFYEALAAMAYQCMVGRTAEELSLGIEVMAECRRNPAIAKLFRDLEDDITARLVKMLETAAARGGINPSTNFEPAATILMMIADGITLRRSANQVLDVEGMMPLILQMVENLLGNPTAQADKLK